MTLDLASWLVGTGSQRPAAEGVAGLDGLSSRGAPRTGELNQATEQDFLQVGEKLQRFLEVSGQISEQCSHLVGFLSGEEATGERGDLRSILERARAMAGQAEINRQALEQMLGVWAGLCIPWRI